jgi:hypothetical protein
MALHDCRLCCYRLRRVCVRARFGASGLTIKQAELWEFGETGEPLRKGRERDGLAMRVWERPVYVETLLLDYALLIQATRCGAYYTHLRRFTMGEEIFFSYSTSQDLISFGSFLVRTILVSW